MNIKFSHKLPLKPYRNPYLFQPAFIFWTLLVAAVTWMTGATLWGEPIPQTYHIIGYLVTCILIFLLAFVSTPVRTFRILVVARRGGIILLIFLSIILGGVLGYFVTPTSWSLIVRILVILVTAYALSIWTTQVLIVITQAALSIDRVSLLNVANSQKQMALQLAARGEHSKFLEYMESCIVLFRSHGYERAVIANHIVIARILRESSDFDGFGHVSAALEMSEGTTHKDLWFDALSLALNYISDQDTQVANKEQLKLLETLRRIPKLDYIRAYIANELFVSYDSNGDFESAADMAVEIVEILDNGFIKGTVIPLPARERILKNIVLSLPSYSSVLGQVNRKKAMEKAIELAERYSNDE